MCYNEFKLSIGFMKMDLFCLVLLWGICVNSFAQSTISYGQISCYCPQTGSMQGGGGAVAITFYDGYIHHSMYGDLQLVQRNNDGSVAYVPADFAGVPGLQLNAVLISSDLQRMEERVTSSVGYMSINLINTYTSMGEDEGLGVQRWAEAKAASKRGNIGSGKSRDETCTSCDGTGISKTPNTGGGVASWVAYYNSEGTRCPYCSRYSRHFHNRCSSCNVPRY